MYINKIIIQDFGPFSNLDITCHFADNGNPVPLILIGKNGSGKTILLSHIVNTLISAKHLLYDDCEVEKGKVYKHRSTSYISTGKRISFSNIEYTDGTYVLEYQLGRSKKELEEEGITNFNRDWDKIGPDQHSFFNSTFTENSASTLLRKRCALYFPSNRFEEPAWLNKDNLTNRIEYQDLNRNVNFSNRSIIALSTLKSCQQWLLDIMLDRNTLEIRTQDQKQIIDGQEFISTLLLGSTGQATDIYNSILALINKIFDESGSLRFGIGTRNNRFISIMKSDESWIPNLFQLSSGESLLLGMFLSILKDYDLSHANFTNLENVDGIVIIDEIDLHLHSILQNEVLPEIIQLFPKIQFIITTHSPMFLLGMEKIFGNGKYDIFELPSGDNISIENFSEFKDFFIAISETKSYEEQLKEKIEETQLPVVFVEGDYDIRYLQKTIEFHYNSDLLNQFTFVDGEGFGNLDNVWKSLRNPVTKSLPSKALLLYDCDIKKKDTTYENISRKTIPINDDNPIKIGIENLLSVDTINKLEEENECYIDVIFEHKKSIRGKPTIIPEQKLINKDEKGNICNWLCDHGEADDFTGFKTAIDMIIEFLESCNNQPAD